MTTIGIGTDIIEVERVARAVNNWGEKFLNRVFCPDEICYARRGGRSFASILAARYAGKESVLKALGTGLAGCRWNEIEIVSRDGTGQPEVILSGRTRQQALSRNIHCIKISLSHCRQYAVAFAVAEGGVPGEARDG